MVEGRFLAESGKMLDEISSMEEIWTEWEQHYAHLKINPKRVCKDGIMNLEKFHDKETQPKILFILRDSNNPKGGSDLREIFKDGPKYQMGYAIARWATGIFKQFPPYKQIERDNSLLKESLLKVAVINLKKTGGASQAILPAINAYAYNDRKLLLKQIHSIKPNLILACGTLDYLIWLLDLNVDPDIPWENPIKDEIREAWIISIRHPIRDNNPQATYERLRKSLEKISSGTGLY